MKPYRLIAVLIMAIIVLGCSIPIVVEEKCCPAETEPTDMPTTIPAPQSEEVVEAPTIEVPECQPMASGKTNCECIEEYLSGTGTITDPIVYPDWYLHDLCFAKAGQGTGAKYITVSGPTALQMGEATGPARMVFIPAGETFKGWTQGGWSYTTNVAMMAQWMPENVESGLYGLICGYERNLGLQVPAYIWDGTKEVRDTSLDCPLKTAPISTPAPVSQVPETQLPVAEAQEAKVTTEEDWVLYPEIFKIEIDGLFYCGARAKNASFPEETRIIEPFPKGSFDGNYLHDSSSSGMGRNAFCGGTAENGKPWTMILLETDGGIYPAEFPLQ